ncbi:MAG: type II secretion system protein GspL [Planctomycetota bacterium]
MAKASAAHVTHDRFSAVVVDGTAKRWKIVSSDAGEIAPTAEGENPTASITAAVTGGLKKIHAPREPFTLAVSSSDSVFRSLQLPFTGDDAIEKVLKFESESQFHQFNIDDVVVEHITIEEHKSATDILVAAVPKKFLRSQIEALDRGGYDPNIVDLDAIALFNGIIGTASVPEQGSSLIIHIGREETIALLIEDRKLRTARSMRTGLSSMQQTVAQDLGISESDAASKVAQLSSGAAPSGDLVSTYSESAPRAELDKRPEELEKDIIEERKVELVKRLQREALRTCAAEARKGPDEVFVCGEGAGIPGIIESLGAALEVPARELDLFANVEGAPSDINIRRRCAIALGAALRGIGIDATNTNFRQEDLKFAKKLESLKIPLAAIAATIAFTILLQNIYTYRELDSKRVTLANIAKVAEDAITVRIPKKGAAIKKYAEDTPADRMRHYRNFLNNELTNLKNIYGAGGTSFTKPQSAWEACDRVFSVMLKMQDDMGLFVLDRFAATTNTSNPMTPGIDVRITMTFFGDGESASKRCVEFRKRLKMNKWCIDTTEGTATPMEGGNGITYEGLTIRVDLTKETQIDK